MEAQASASEGESATSTASPDGDEEGVAVTSASQPRRLTEAERFELVTGPTGTEPAKVVQLTGHHYHNPTDPNEFAENGGEAFLRNTLLKQLKFGTVELPPTLEEQRVGTPSKTVTMNELGISYPVLLYVPNVVEVQIPNPDLFPLPPGVAPPDSGRMGDSSGQATGRSSRGQGGGGGAQPTNAFMAYAAQRGVRPFLTVRRFDFVIQFAWEITPPSVRKQNAENAEGGLTEGTSNE